mmetsp:Transcript_20692/g.45414  ORF Transcript_20692/g.45414 Transcript_20692/m.45414 type:complete len:714 (-) Transcript_20692:200-2341(-)
MACKLLLAAVSLLARTQATPLRVIRTAFDATSPELLKEQPASEMVAMASPSGSVLTVDSTVKYQEFIGFGGAFTEAAAINWRKMTEEDQAKIIHLYFADPSEGGHGYTMGRVPIGSCDFSPDSYSFDNVPDDVDLTAFDKTVAHDEKSGMLPMIRAALKTAEARGHKMQIYASPWSPPAWMKLPIEGAPSMLHSAGPNGLNPKFQRTWAKFFSAFIDAYRARGVDLWGITVQNEPENNATWEGCLYTPEFQAEFVRDHLGPVMHSEQPGVKIFGFDHNKDNVAKWAQVLYADPGARKYLDGLAVHWYGGLNTDHLETTHEIAPEKSILASEACNCNGVVYKNEAESWWSRAEDLALDILEDFRFWVIGWTDWNLVLSHTGGPNKVNNTCDANIICDPHEKMGMGTVILQASYYYMGHFSRFIPPGSRRIALTNSVAGAVPTITAGDVSQGKLALEDCKEDPIQKWTYKEGKGVLSLYGLCALIPGSVFYEWGFPILYACSGMGTQSWHLEKVPGGVRIVEPSVKMCFTKKTVKGNVVGLDAGVTKEAILLFNCAAAGSANQTFQIDSFGDEAYPTGFQLKSDGKCVQPVAQRRPHFDAVAFETPKGEISMVVLNIGDNAVDFTIYDNSSQTGSKDVKLPGHSIATFMWPSKAAAGMAVLAEAEAAQASGTAGFFTLAAAVAFLAAFLITAKPVVMRYASRREAAAATGYQVLA